MLSLLFDLSVMLSPVLVLFIGGIYTIINEWLYEALDDDNSEEVEATKRFLETLRHETQDEATERNVPYCFLNVAQQNADLGLTLTTHTPKTGKKVIPYRPPVAGLAHRRMKVNAFLYDEDIAAQESDEPIKPRELVRWEDDNDVTDCSFELDQREGWDVNEMFETNATEFGYKSTFEECLSEYTTLLVDTSPDYTARWERACRLADEIKTGKKVEQANQLKRRKKKAGHTKKINCHF